MSQTTPSYQEPQAVPLPQRKSLASSPRMLTEVRKQRSFANCRAIGALVLREMQTSNSRSSGGYLWTIADPVGGIILLTIIFSAGFRAPPLGVNFAIFYATGVVPFMAYLDMSNKIAGLIRYSKPLLFYPAVNFAHALLARIFLNFITHTIIASIIFFGIFIFMETRTDPQIEQIALGMLMSLLLACAVGSINCFLFGSFPWWQQFWGIIMRPLFIVSCVFFLYDDIPDPYSDWLWWNPLIHVVGQMRHAFYPSYKGYYISYIYVFSIALGLSALGLTLLFRFHRDLQNS